MRALRAILTLIILTLLVSLHCIYAFSVESVLHNIMKSIANLGCKNVKIEDIRCVNHGSTLNITLRLGNTFLSRKVIKMKYCRCMKNICYCTVDLPPVSKNLERYCYAKKIGNNMWIIDISIETQSKINVVGAGMLYREYIIYFPSSASVKLTENLTLITGRETEIYCPLMRSVATYELGSYVIYTFKPTHKVEVTSRVICGVAHSRSLVYMFSVYVSIASLVICAATIGALSLYMIKLRSQRV